MGYFRGRLHRPQRLRGAGQLLHLNGACQRSDERHDSALDRRAATHAVPRAHQPAQRQPPGGRQLRQHRPERVRQRQLHRPPGSRPAVHGHRHAVRPPVVHAHETQPLRRRRHHHDGSGGRHQCPRSPRLGHLRRRRPQQISAASYRRQTHHRRLQPHPAAEIPDQFLRFGHRDLSLHHQELYRPDGPAAAGARGESRQGSLLPSGRRHRLRRTELLLHSHRLHLRQRRLRPTRQHCARHPLHRPLRRQRPHHQRHRLRMWQAGRHRRLQLARAGRIGKQPHRQRLHFLQRRHQHRRHSRLQRRRNHQL